MTAKKVEPGVRVELHPGYDLWMRGARFGRVTRLDGEIAVVRMDHPQVKRPQRVTIEDLVVR